MWIPLLWHQRHFEIVESFVILIHIKFNFEWLFILEHHVQTWTLFLFAVDIELRLNIKSNIRQTVGADELFHQF